MIDKSMYFEHLWTYLWYFLHRAVLSKFATKGGVLLREHVGGGVVLSAIYNQNKLYFHILASKNFMS